LILEGSNMAKASNLHKYHVVLVSGDERDINGSDARAEHGALVIRDTAGEAVTLYAPGEWRLCEAERRDDRT